MQCPENETIQRRKSVDLIETQARVRRATQIFHEYGGDIRKIIRFKVKDESLAEDLYQDLYLSLVSAKLPPKIKNMKRFLYRAITNDVISVARRTRRRNELMKLYSQDYRATELAEGGPDERMMRDERKDVVFQQLEEHLCPSEYQAVLWRFQRDGNNQEAAKDLGVKKESFIRYLCTGLKKLRKLDWNEEVVSR
jgi:RNA polymerase sigma factor (sigma-70 family)